MSSALFQIIFNPTSAAELAAMPKDLQLQVLGEFRGLPDEVRASGYYGKLQSGVKTHESWKHFIDVAYWNVELGEDQT